MIDFSEITACGECCVGCEKKVKGICPGCIEAEGRVPEWAGSGVCRVYACCKEHNAQFCGLCKEFPCDKLPQMISWNPDIVEHLTELRDEYHDQSKSTGISDKDILEMVQLNWDLENPVIQERFDEGSARLMFRIKTDIRDYLVKGIPDTVPESTIKSNTSAHMYLGNENGMAPGIYPAGNGNYYINSHGYWFYLMDFIDGRNMRETPEDEFRIGQATRKLHSLKGYNVKSPMTQGKDRFYSWFRDHEFVREFDDILDSLPDFGELDQCFVHTDIGPHNTMLGKNGEVIFIDLDDSGIGSRYLDLGWPFIMQFVDFNHDTEEMHYRFDLAQSFLRGYYGTEDISGDEYELIFKGAEQMHISYMQVYGPYAVDSLWKILKFGIDQKDRLWRMISEK